MSHIQFSRDSRIELATLLWAKKNHSECALRLGMNRSSISREFNNNIVPVEVRNVAVAIDLANGALCEKPSMPLPADSFAQAVSNP